MRFLFAIAFLPGLMLQAFSQKLKKYDKVILASLQTHIRYLAGDMLGGRRTGTPGEKLAGDYIIEEFTKAELEAGGQDKQWRQSFDVDDGKQIDSSTFFSINGTRLVLNEEFFPLAYCPSMSIEGSPAMALQENGVPWFFDLKELLEE